MNKTDNRAARAVQKVLFWCEVAFAMLLSALAIFLHARALYSSGPLWRDEVSSLSVALAPTLHDFWQRIQPDNFPPLYFLMLRAWHALGLGDNDFALRVSSFAICSALIVAWWRVSWRINQRAPIWLLSLVGIGALTFQCADQLRPYGLCALLLTICYGAFWRLSFEKQSWRRLATASVVATLAVQASYIVAIFIGVLTLAALVVLVRSKEFRAAALVFIPGIIAAISLTPYLIGFREHHTWLVLLPGADSFSAVFDVLRTALDSNFQFAFLVWSALTFGLVVFFALKRDERVQFSLVAIILSVGLTLLFFRLLHWQTHPRYFFLLLCFVALALQSGLTTIMRKWIAGGVALLGAAAIIFAQISPAYFQAGVRQSNCDLIAEALEQRAGADDFIFLTGFWHGLSFEHYYHGTTHWASLPDISDHTIYRWDLVMQEMALPDPLRRIFEEMEKTLRSGHKVFLVGSLMVEMQQTAPISPAPHPQYGWELSRYMANWQIQIGYWIEHHAVHGDNIEVSPQRPVSAQENLGLFQVSGWRGES